MDVSVNPLATARHPRQQPTRRTPPRPTVATAHGTTARAAATLALSAYGLVDLVEDLGAPWAWLVQALALALLAAGFVVAARRSPDHRFAWLLSGAVAGGLAIATCVALVDAVLVSIST